MLNYRSAAKRESSGCACVGASNPRRDVRLVRTADGEPYAEHRAEPHRPRTRADVRISENRQQLKTPAPGRNTGDIPITATYAGTGLKSAGENVVERQSVSSTAIRASHTSLLPGSTRSPEPEGQAPRRVPTCLLIFSHSDKPSTGT